VVPNPLPTIIVSLSSGPNFTVLSATPSASFGSATSTLLRGRFSRIRNRLPPVPPTCANARDDPIQSVPSLSAPSASPRTNVVPAGPDSYFQLNSGSEYFAPGSMNSRSRASPGSSASLVGGEG